MKQPPCPSFSPIVDLPSCEDSMNKSRFKCGYPFEKMDEDARNNLLKAGVYPFKCRDTRNGGKLFLYMINDKGEYVGTTNIDPETMEFLMINF